MLFFQPHTYHNLTCTSLILETGAGQDTLWDDVQKQRQEGGYPWTHLSHDQDAEVWIDPAALPNDISR